jgi:hypothetical protein
VYDSVENTKDLQFLHRFSHLNRAGLMEAVREKTTPDELTTVAINNRNETYIEQADF